MDTKARHKLEEAKAHCYAWRLSEAYAIFRRFYDRLPFQPEEEHAEYIGMYVRILLELGKDYELKFYMNELERLYQKWPRPAVGYQLAYVYHSVSEPCTTLAKEIFEKIVADPTAGSFHVKAKVMLVLHYNGRGEIFTCRSILDSLEDPTDDVSLSRVVRIWRALIGRKEGKLAEAERWIDEVLAECTFESDWYNFFSAKIEQFRICLALDQRDRMSEIFDQLKHLTEHKRCKTIQSQLEHLAQQLRQDNFQKLSFLSRDDENILSYGGKAFTFKGETLAERLLLLFVKRRSIDKKMIIEKLYARTYRPERDDKLIHYQIHFLRKRLECIGLPAGAISFRNTGYRLLPEVEILGECG